MKLLLSILASQSAFSASAFALDVQASTGVYYFTSSQEKISAAQTEAAEENQIFQSRKDPRALAREFAREELAKGNVCLSQAAQDLRSALRSKLVSRMCKDIFSADISKAQAIARSKKWKADSLRCEASLEALETPGKMKVVLAFRSSIVMSERLPAKLARAGFGQAPQSWTFPPHEAALGESAGGWKGILKNRSCSLDESTMNEHLERFKEKAREIRVLARCRQRLDEQVSGLSRVQSRFRLYVPAEWLSDAGGNSVNKLLQAVPQSNPGMDMKACGQARRMAAERMEELRDLSESIASRHDIPALNPKSWPEGRKLASEEEEQE